jgi:TPR repeat protein
MISTNDSTIASLADATERGDRSAADALFAALYSELHRLARRELARQGVPLGLSATTLLHQAYLMYAAGEGTKVDRPAAFLMFFQAALFGMKGARQEALAAWQQMGTTEQRKTADKLRERRLDPAKVIAALQKQTS